MRRRLLAVAVAAVAAAVVTGCDNMHPGQAVVIDNGDYQASIGKLDFQKLQESKIPLIVGIIVEGYDHFVVVRGTDGIYVYLADSARGNIRVLKEDFLKQWQKNLALVVVKPGVDPNRVSPLAVRPDEMSLGELNRLFVRRQLSTNHRGTIQPPPGN